MTGVLPIHKTKGVTSRYITSSVRRLAGGAKAGHAGTLDPIATGVLPVLLGRATRLADLLPGDKTYRVTFKTGITTDSGDITGNILETSGKETPPERVEEMAMSFVGRIMQTPPMYSAVKYKGRPLYSLARKGIVVERRERAVEIYSVTDFLPLGQNQYCMTVRCSKGTYIRALCGDIGEDLGTGAVMTELCRTESSGIALEKCILLSEAEDLTGKGGLDKSLLTAESLFCHCPEIYIDETGVRYYKNGGVIDEKRLSRALEEDVVYRAYENGGNFLGLGGLYAGNDGIKGIKSIYSSEDNAV